jgi:hypothetical protein
MAFNLSRADPPLGRARAAHNALLAEMGLAGTYAGEAVG